MSCDISNERLTFDPVKDVKILEKRKEDEKQAMQDAFWKAVEEHGATNVLQSMFDHYCR